MVGRSMPKLASNRLVEMLERWGESALAQRLGYFADLHGVDLQPGLRAALERLVRPGSRVLLGPRGRWGTTGMLGRRPSARRRRLGTIVPPSTRATGAQPNASLCLAPLCEPHPPKLGINDVKPNIHRRPPEPSEIGLPLPRHHPRQIVPYQGITFFH